jgi:hypothetical protein
MPLEGIDNINKMLDAQFQELPKIDNVAGATKYKEEAGMSETAGIDVFNAYFAKLDSLSERDQEDLKKNTLILIEKIQAYRPGLYVVLEGQEEEGFKVVLSDNNSPDDKALEKIYKKELNIYIRQDVNNRKSIHIYFTTFSEDNQPVVPKEIIIDISEEVPKVRGEGVDIGDTMSDLETSMWVECFARSIN